MKENIEKMTKKSGPLAENEVKDILRAYGISTTKYVVVKNEADLSKIKLSFPVALKVCSDKILHKTDVGGVRLNIEDMTELKQAFKDFRKKFPKDDLLVDQMAEKGVELIIGLVQDPTFGMSIMFGVGGIFTELYKDVTFRVIPLQSFDAENMVEEIKGKALLEGFRGMKVNKKLVIDLINKVGKIGEDLIDNIDQMDLNPVFVYEKGYCVVDAKMILK